MADVRDYTVGCICALPVPEGLALRQFFDEVHDPPRIPAAHVSSPNRPLYATGTMGSHKVVIGHLPEGSYGIASATTVIDDMVRSFPNLRCCLMVGIGGGAPNLPDHDIRLGDVVVSSPRNSVGGVLQYDHGKAVQNKPFHSTQHLNEPPKYLMSAVGELRIRYEEDDMPLQRMVNEALAKKPKLRQRYQRPSAETDRLYRSDHLHPDNKPCSGLCRNDASKLVDRPQREEGPDDLLVHRGIIASGSGLMKDAEIRDRWAKEKDVLCFEMEAAGLMNAFPCLVIRGICDYSDTHKNDQWQNFAAMMAAAYAKQILMVLQPWVVEDEVRITGRDIEGIKDQVSQVNKTLDEAIQVKREADEAHLHEKILEWLTTIDFTDRQNRAYRARHRDTGEWFLGSTEFQNWIRAKGQTLFCPGKPGAGKTIMASIAIHHLQSIITPAAPGGIAYIFCDYREQLSEEVVLGCIMKQLVGYTPSFPTYALDLYLSHAHHDSRPSVDELREALCGIVNSFEQSCCFIVIDALDECEEVGAREEMISILELLREKTKANILATSRSGIPTIAEKFRGALQVHIQAPVSDLNAFLDDRITRDLPILRQKSSRIGLDPEVYSHRALTPADPTKELHMEGTTKYETKEPSHYDYELHEEIKIAVTTVADGVFLIAMLLITSLKGKINTKQVKDALKEIPSGGSVRDNAYDKTMNMILSQRKEYKILGIKALIWVAFAPKPLTLGDLRHALAVEIGTDDLNPENITDPEFILSACAGLIVFGKGNQERVTEQRMLVYLVHETTQQYLDKTRNRWFQHAKRYVADVSLTYLTFQTFGLGPCLTEKEYAKRIDRYPLYPYLTTKMHIRQSSNDNELLRKFFLSEKHVQSYVQAQKSTENRIFFLGTVAITWNALHLAMYSQPTSILSELLPTGINEQNHHHETPLHIALKRGYREGIQILLSASGINIDITGCFPGTALTAACFYGNEEAVRLMLATNAQVPDNCTLENPEGHSPFSWAVKKRHTGIIKLLLQAKYPTGHPANASFRGSPLDFAIRRRDTRMASALLEHIYVAAGNWVQDALELSASSAHHIYFKLLRNKFWEWMEQNPDWKIICLKEAALKATDRTLKYVLKVLRHGQNVKRGRNTVQLSSTFTPPVWESVSILDIVTLTAAEINTRDEHHQTALHVAASRNDMRSVRVLVKLGADLQVTNAHGQSAKQCIEEAYSHTCVDPLERRLFEENNLSRSTYSPQHFVPTPLILRASMPPYRPKSEYF